MTTPELTTTPVAEVEVTVSGDIGGLGVSRFRFIRNDAGVLTVADCNAAGAAIRSFLQGANFYPNSVSWVIQGTVNLFEIDSALVQGSITMSSIPAAVPGTASGNYPAGMGARVNWKTSQVHGRRLMRGCTFLVPFTTTAYTGQGALTATCSGQVTGAANGYVTAMAAANLVPVVWHRPLKGTTSGGVIGNITGASVPTTPAGLRSRRH